MLANIHIPKNAGTTLNAVLQRNFGDRFRVLDLTEAAHERSPAIHALDGFFLPPVSASHCLSELEALRSEGIRAVSAHHLHPLDAATAEQHGLRFMTFIRHPVDRLLSLYHYERKWSAREPGRFGADHCSQRPFEEFVEHRAETGVYLDNWQCHCLTGEPASDPAIERLSTFFFVGLVEEWDRSMILLRQAIRDDGIAADFYIDYVRMNGVNAKERAGVRLSKSLRRELTERNSEDMALYEYARERVTSEWQGLTGRHGAYGRLMAERIWGYVRRRRLTGLGIHK